MMELETKSGTHFIDNPKYHRSVQTGLIISKVIDIDRLEMRMSN